jgi:hypothetical protein
MLLALLKLGFSYTEALAMPWSEAFAYLDAVYGKRPGKKYLVKRD